MEFDVFDTTGKKLGKGDVLKDFRGDTWHFLGCWHPRKITASRAAIDPIGQQLYPTVFNLTIKEKERA